jgi:hypothetical protein
VARRSMQEEGSVLRSVAGPRRSERPFRPDGAQLPPLAGPCVGLRVERMRLARLVGQPVLRSRQAGSHLGQSDLCSGPARVIRQRQPVLTVAVSKLATLKYLVAGKWAPVGALARPSS